jgi:folate-binding protein YgfZ
MVVSSSDHAAQMPEGYEALTSDAGAYEDTSRLVFHVKGKRVPEIMNGLVTADLVSVHGDAAFPTLILTPRGKVLADAVVIRIAGDIVLDVPASAWSDLKDHFSTYLPTRFAQLEPSGLRVVRVHGPRATERERTDQILFAMDHPVYTERDGSHRSVAAFRGGFAVRLVEGFDLYLPADQAHDLDLPNVSDEAWDIWRIERGIPLYGQDISLKNLPQETDLVPVCVSFAKGCYTGQEVLARIHYRGHVNRHLRGIHLVGPTTGIPIAPGDELTLDGKIIGTVTSAALSPVHGWIGLGYVRREVEPGTEVVVRRDGQDADIPLYASVTDLPFTL